jgi:hypothetical protein
MQTGNHQSTSEFLLSLVREFPGERMRLQDLIDGLGERSFGFLLLLFGVACAIAPPGFATIFSIPLMFFGLQMLAGFATPWLPASIAKRSFAKTDMEATLRRAVPAMRWVERICKPRFEFLIGNIGERLLGLLVFILAVVIALPGPGTNFPPGVAIAFMSIAIIERDGLLVFAGVLASFAALYIGWLGIHLLFTEILPWIWPWIREHLVETWTAIAG